MKISERWLREWVDPPLDAAGVAEVLTLAGLEVDGLLPAAPPLAGVVVAEVRAVAPHPQAEHLRICEVFDGAAVHQVVCGAPNVRIGLLTAYARPATQLPDGRRIADGVIRGAASAGMLCSAAELGLGDDGDGILELPPGTHAGLSLEGVLGLDDRVFDVNLTPNRGDCFSVIGIARDLAALTVQTMRPVEFAPVAAASSRRLAVRIEDGAGCPHYAGRVIVGVDRNARTPLWMQERLRRAGVRAIHPLVDVTNYVMLELGQPMHAFDFDRLDRGIRVRGAQRGERLQLLDGQDIELDDGVLVIADEAAPVALAGVMGGLASAVSTATVNVFLESAFFEPVRLAGVARRYRLQTDASTRFERGVDPTRQVRAVERATALILEVCGGTPGPCELTAADGPSPHPPAIDFRPAAVERLLGMRVEEDVIEAILTRLDMQVRRAGTNWQVMPPAFRADIALEADLVEEIARVHGYHHIPVRLPIAPAMPALPTAESSGEHAMRQCLIGRGYWEAITYSFIDPALAALLAPLHPGLPLANPISSEMSVMRASLWPGLVAAARHNLNRQADAVRLFEIGMAFIGPATGGRQAVHVGGVRCGPAHGSNWDPAPRVTDFYDLKQDVEALFQKLRQVEVQFEADAHPALHPGQAARVSIGGRPCGWLGALHPALASRLEIRNRLFLFEFDCDAMSLTGPAQYQPISRFPHVRRDLSIVVDDAIAAADCMSVAREAAGELLRDLQLFDVYRGQGIDSGKKSLALGLIFQAHSSTLTDDEVENAVKRVLTQLAARFGGSLRN